MSRDGNHVEINFELLFIENTALFTKASRVFNEADKNKSGELSPEGLNIFIRKLTNLEVDKILNPYKQMEMFGDLDKDHDGKLAKKGKVIVEYTLTCLYNDNFFMKPIFSRTLGMDSC